MRVAGAAVVHACYGLVVTSAALQQQCRPQQQCGFVWSEDGALFGRRSCHACHVNLIRAARPIPCCTAAVLATAAVCCVLSAQNDLILPADPTTYAVER
jgi:hypothetical protein